MATFFRSGVFQRATPICFFVPQYHLMTPVVTPQNTFISNNNVQGSGFQQQQSGSGGRQTSGARHESHRSYLHHSFLYYRILFVFRINVYTNNWVLHWVPEIWKHCAQRPRVNTVCNDLLKVFALFSYFLGIILFRTPVAKPRILNRKWCKAHRCRCNAP